MNEIDIIRASILSRIKPTDPEKQKLSALADSLIGRIIALGRAEGLDISAILVGSTARCTWLSGEHDLDIFIMFPPEVSREYLEEKGLYVARKMAEQAQSCEERYAEHPYINAVFDGCEVDLVPAFGVASAAEIKSAVDRTPFHNKFVLSRIQGLEDEVLLLKQFLKGCGVYGSELKTHGFSGYLVELLVIYYGSFMGVLEAVQEWKPGMMIDIEKHASISHNDPLVMVDPTDPARNVAAALSLDNMCIFIDSAREFLKKPDISFFSLRVVEPLPDSEFKNIMSERGTSLIAIEFTAPDEVDDVLFPQLHKMEDSVREMLERYDFRVYNSGVWAGKKAVLVYELESAGLPTLKKHTGPQVWMEEHAASFKSKYTGSNAFSNVYIRNGKYMVEIPRKYIHAKKLLESELPKCGLGKHVALSIKKVYHILENEQILTIKENDFREFLHRFFKK
ncbi:MAG: CCA tRNA nucleotidyltransferase [Candidatus Methanoperedens sp.]|nr:CCA tRNA nucleotidyltransferase [Candidatus Methanoperedens sp.]